MRGIFHAFLLLSVVFYREIEVGCCSLMIGHYPKCSDSKHERTDYVPADKAEVLNEELHFVAVHYTHALVNALSPIVFGMVTLNVISHRVGECLYNSGNYEKHGPESGEDSCHKSDKEGICEAIGKSLEEMLKAHGLVIACLLKENICNSISERSGDENSTESGNNRARNA